VVEEKEENKEKELSVSEVEVSSALELVDSK
jgi:hypothetical protein